MPAAVDRRIRVLVAKPGLDGHDRGAKVVALALRDAGMEVIYTGLHQTPASIAKAAAEESVDVVGLSVLSGAHLHLAKAVVREMRGRGAADVPVVVGGVVPDADIGRLREIGVADILPSGTGIEEVVRRVREVAERRRGSD